LKQWTGSRPGLLSDVADLRAFVRIEAEVKLAAHDTWTVAA